MSDDNPMVEILATHQRLETGQTKLEAHQTKFEAAQEAMEARLMARLNDAQEKLIERMRLNETAVSALTEIARGTNTMLSMIAGAITDLGRRVTDLEKKG